MNKSFNMSADQISKVVRSCVMKRTKEQVGIKMPTLNEKVVEVEFETEKEEKFAKNIHNLMSFATVTSKNVDEIITNMGSRIQCRFPIMMLMRQCCVYPKLSVRYFRKKYKNECNRLGMKKNFNDIGHSKLNAVVNKVIENKGNGKKKLIFCLFTKEIDVLKKLIEKAGISAKTVCGSTPKKLRKKRLRTPEKEEDGPEVLIVQIQTACEGLNLQHINEVYFTTPHWNPSVEDQAIARAHRIGQKKAVDVYRFVSKFQNKKDDTSITLDEYCMTVQEKKREIAKSIFA